MRIVQKKFIGGSVYPSYYYDILSGIGSDLASEEERPEFNYTLNPATSEDYYRMQEELANLPETPLQTAARYIGYAIDPLGGAAEYVQNSDWAPNWLKRSAPYIAMAGNFYRRGGGKGARSGKVSGGSTGGNYDPVPATPKKGRLRTDEFGNAIGSNPAASRGQSKSRFSETAKRDSGMDYNDNGEYRGASRRRARHVRTSEDDPLTVSLTAELARELWGKPKAQLTQAAATETPSSMVGRKRGRRSAKDAKLYREMYVASGTGIDATTSKTKVLSSLLKYFTAVSQKYAELVEQAAKVKGAERTLIDKEIARLRLTFNKEMQQVRGYGHLFEIPADLKKQMNSR